MSNGISRRAEMAIATGLALSVCIATEACGGGKAPMNPETAGGSAVAIAGNRAAGSGTAAVVATAGSSGQTSSSATPASGGSSASTMMCGAPMQDCCAGGVCMSGARCLQNKCFSCGAPGQQCCSSNLCQSGCCVNNVCLAPGASCGATGGMCNADGCSACGGAAEGCCPGGGCHSGLVCKSSNAVATVPGTSPGAGPGAAPTAPAAMSCTACGHANEACCPDRTCTDGICVGTLNTACRSDCGGADQPCCNLQGGMACASDLSCIGMMCQRCGKPGQPCCMAADAGMSMTCGGFGLTCVDGQCAQCGGPGGPCCSGTFACVNGQCTNGKCSD